MSSTRNAAISALALAMVRPSSSTSVNRVVSWAVKSPLIVVSTAKTTSATRSGSIKGWRARIAASRSASVPCSRRGSAAGVSGIRQHLFDLVLQRFRVERLDDVVGHAGLLRSDDVLHLAFGGDHDERRLVELGVRPNLLQQLQARHR